MGNRVKELGGGDGYKEREVGKKGGIWGERVCLIEGKDFRGCILSGIKIGRMFGEGVEDMLIMEEEEFWKQKGT